MKLNISRITEIVEDYKPIEDVILKVYKERENYIPYTLIESKSTGRKLVLKNGNHRNMVHKHLVFEHFYIVMVLTLSLSLYQLVKGNYLMLVLLFIAGALLMFKLLKDSDVPHKLIFDGLSIYELNHVGKRIAEFNPSMVECSDSNEYENNFIFISTSNFTKSRNERMKSLIILEGNEFGVRGVIREYFNRLKINFN